MKFILMETLILKYIIEMIILY